MYRFMVGRTLFKRLQCQAIGVNKRYYQCSGAGVYGFRPKKDEPFELDDNVLKTRQQQSNFYRWIEAFRSHSHHIAHTNPIELKTNSSNILPELQLQRYGLDEDQTLNFRGILNNDTANGTVRQARDFLKRTYCGNVSIEYSYIESEHEREWLVENYEKLISNANVSSDAKKEILELMLKSQAWDNFLAIKFPTYKRYGGEGAESIMSFFRQLMLLATENEVNNIVLAMPHRGKLNLLTTIFNTPAAKIFHKLKGFSEFPPDVKVMGDIASHFHVSEDFEINGKKVHLSMLHNPSHLEAVNPVSMGKTRSKQQTLHDGAFSDDAEKQFGSNVINVQLHGDAAFSGQGINQEMLMMSRVPHFEVGGTIHMIINNQVGFTTPGDRGRSTKYCTDLAKCIMAPVFHVNGDDPEAMAIVTCLAFAYQQKFRKDVFIDFVCFRRWGHNEMDDPTFTNPAIYKLIHTRKSVPDSYADRLIQENVVTDGDVKRCIDNYRGYLNDELDKAISYKPKSYYYQKQWEDMKPASSSITTWDTGMDYSILHYVGIQSVSYPKQFTIHPHLLKTHVNNRLKRLENGQRIDWATAEAMAIGSLMYQGHNVRISGEDVGRGTFSQRHAMLVDQQTNEIYIPLNDMSHGNGGKIEIANSILSEEAVLGFEYGMALDNPNNLIIWEAQFGDFYNGAQIIIDTFIVSGETKWMYANGLVMLLPHGFDGMASEHSSCRIERFLQLTDSKECSPEGDDVNLQIVNPTTPAQYFHVLRRQMVRNFRKPLIVVGPKTLLRLADATSDYTDFVHGTTFKPVIEDVIAMETEKVKRVILCSGKHYYNLNAFRNENKIRDVAIVRVESLCPFPVKEINDELNKYKNAKEFVWSQEEHRNMGAWSFIRPRFENMCGRKIGYVGRSEGATIAVGVSSIHKIEAEQVIVDAFKGL
ncbi:probable 2-oxoglutarate dehydrogenase E1 component DHKTD1 homolog, mitochondrial [Contarinia nasturtii]|uniref:probable 2-oxoglutarate dehydrogenase E1 component DHKTD1 homolog, mitochondrial n=1 Tax=Contarinia nasturtii TaxID=265458 RepID=UPI0012D42DFD|nr:probable 2-oxoglutarate dehydrogenase E1 component DHKTD1 homolog, mitochondrial [Contarinia nasturtii]